MPSSREIALQALVDSERNDRFIDQSLERLLSARDLEPRDTALATELTYGVVRRRLSLDHVLNRLASRPLSAQPVALRNILRLGAYQLIFCDSIPPHAAVNEAVELARQYGHPGLVRFTNGVLRALSREEDPLRLDGIENTVRRLAVEFSHPEWLVQRWLNRWGEVRTRQLLAAGNEQPSLVLRTNTLRTVRSELMKRLGGEGAEVLAADLHPWAVKYSSGPAVHTLGSFHDGWFVVQAEASMIVADALGARPGETILDACAAPGGKTTHLAQRLHDQGCIYALDTSARRLAKLYENIERLGLQCIRAVQGDAREAAKYTGGLVDRVLVDVPCSNLGVLARRADARWNRTESDLHRLATLQLEILTAAARLVRPGGVLVYSTCTLEPEENDQVIRSFISEADDFKLAPLQGLVPAELLGDEDPGYLQLYPDIHGTDGMFFARLQKNNGGS